MPKLMEWQNTMITSSSCQALAAARTKSFITLEALAGYLEAQSWQIGEIQAGLAEAQGGEFASDEEVAAVFAKYGA